MTAARPPEPAGDLRQWAQSLVNYLQRKDSQVPTLRSTTEPARDGQVFWYPTTNQLVVHYNGSYYPITVGAAL